VVRTPISDIYGPLAALVPSLQVTEIGCALKVDKSQKLLSSSGIRTCFDYFRSSFGEKTKAPLVYLNCFYRLGQLKHARNKWLNLDLIKLNLFKKMWSTNHKYCYVMINRNNYKP
jgi:hypothetical protein